jgi:hypothetical protein
VASGLLTCVVLTLGAATLAFDSHYHCPALLRIDPIDAPFHGPRQVITHLSSVIPFFDSRGQTLAHLLMVGLVGLLVVGVARCDGWWRSEKHPGLRWLLEITLTFLTGVILLRAASDLRPLGLLIGGCALVVLWVWGRPILGARENALFLAAGLVVLAAATLPAFLQRLDLSEHAWSRIVFIQYHYSAVLGAADQLVAGRRLFADVFPNYGSLLPVAAAAVQRRLRPWSMGDYLRVLQALQALYLLVAAWLYHQHARGRWFFVLPALLLVIPWYHFAHRGLLAPNQTPWRAIAIPLAAALLLLLARRRLSVTAFALGAAGAAALLLNFETGVAVIAGLAAYLVFRHGARRGLGRLAVLSFLGAGLSFLVFALGYRWALGHSLGSAWLLLLGWRASLLAVTGCNGLPLTAVTWPSLVFGQAVFVLFHTALRTPPPAPWRASFRAFVATTLLVWFAYFAYRPSEWSLSSYYLLYGFLVIDAARYLVREVFVRRRLNPLLAFGLAASLSLGLPRIVEGNAAAAQEAWRALTISVGAPVAPSREVSGLLLPQPGADDVLNKARYLRHAAAFGPPLYFTADLYLIPKVSGVLSSGLPVGLDLEMITKADYERILADLVASPSSQILFDAPGSEANRAPLLRSFLQQVRRDVSSHFRPVRLEAGWEIWQRIQPAPGAAVQTADSLCVARIPIGFVRETLHHVDN